MFRVHQVKLSSCGKRYRGQHLCRGNHHHHFLTTTPCSQYHTERTSSVHLTGMPPFLNLSNYQSNVNKSQQLDSVALSKTVSQSTPENNSLEEVNDDSDLNKTTIEDENTSSRTIQETSIISRTTTSNTTSDMQSLKGGPNNTIEEDSVKSLEEKDLELTWINWDMPGNHTPCPFHPRNVTGQLSIQARRPQILTEGISQKCALLHALVLHTNMPPYCAKMIKAIKMFALRMVAAVRSKKTVTVPIDIRELLLSYEFLVDAPGLNHLDLKVQVEKDKVLKISGESRPNLLESNQEIKFVLSERNLGRFMRKFNLPSYINLDGITAVCEDGLLTVVVPKYQPPAPQQPRTFDVPISLVTV